MNIWEKLFSSDWNVLTEAASQWLHGGNPYGLLALSLERPGTFAYPPTALTWLSVFIPLGAAGYYVWTALQMGAWWLIIRNRLRSQLVLLLWSPLFFHLLVGQITMGAVLAMWAATVTPRRGFRWGLAVAWAMTKPQAALLPAAWMLWHDRALAHRNRFRAGIVVGTVALALPPTLMNPAVWLDWLHSLSDYRARSMQMAPWQGFAGIIVLLSAFLLWYYRNRENQAAAGWQWWLSAALFPQTSTLYPGVVLLPLLTPSRSYWTIAGLALSSVLIGPATDVTMPVILSGHILAAWFICGGPRTGNLKPAREE